MLPPHIAKLRHDPMLGPIPYALAHHEGQPVANAWNPEILEHCIAGEICPFCGTKLGKHRVLLFLGVLNILQRSSLVPPAHLLCAIWAAQAPHALGNEPLFTIEAHDQYDHRRAGNTDYLSHDRENKPKTVTWWRRGQVLDDPQVIAAGLQRFCDRSLLALDPKAQEGLRQALKYALAVLVPNGSP